MVIYIQEGGGGTVHVGNYFMYSICNLWNENSQCSSIVEAEIVKQYHIKLFIYLWYLYW